MHDTNEAVQALLPLLYQTFVLTSNIAIRIVNERMMEEFKKANIPITPRECWILMLVNGRNDMNQRTVAKLLCINTNVMVRHVDKLEKEGYLKRTIINNRRENVLLLTVKGANIMRSVIAKNEEMCSRIFHPIPLDVISEARTSVLIPIIAEYYATHEDRPRYPHGEV